MQEKEKIQHIPMKMYRTAELLSIAAPMPGLQPEDILVTVAENGQMIVQGSLRGLLKDVKELLLDEWSIGGYYRELALPDHVDAKHANATYGNGVLVVAFPVSARTIAATLVLEKTGIDHGEYIGNMHRVVQP
ncbi:MAG TPA: Hsp20/alpha crystallin family protein [Dictyobacter sp.]|jgi:HSP20 family protein|nr:Hsp20/alpha crystallin family protein [Dictyobacter sp.]